jgi:outer membrane protein OmpA-like peptidoglycan-associated protein
MKRLIVLASVAALGFLGACAGMEEEKKAEATPAAKPAAAKKELPPSGSPFTVYFKNNSPDMTEKSHSDFYDILTKVGTYKVEEVTVRIYSDLTGSPAYNKKLAEQRGKYFEEALKDAGAKKINIEAIGAADPVVDKKGKVDANRRAVIVFAEKKKAG